MMSITTRVTRHQIVRAVELFALIMLAVLPFWVGGSAYAMGLLTLLVIYAVSLIGLDATVGYSGPGESGACRVYGPGRLCGRADGDALWREPDPGLAGGGAGRLVLGGLLAIPALRLEGHSLRWPLCLLARWPCCA